MDNIALEYRLKRAERRVAEGYEYIKRQREVLADLARYGDTEAKKMRRSFWFVLKIYRRRVSSIAAGSSKKSDA